MLQGLSGRALRKLPFLAHAQMEPNSSSVAIFLSVLHRSALNEIVERSILWFSSTLILKHFDWLLLSITPTQRYSSLYCSEHRTELWTTSSFSVVADCTIAAILDQNFPCEQQQSRVAFNKINLYLFRFSKLTAMHWQHVNINLWSNLYLNDKHKFLHWRR